MKTRSIISGALIAIFTIAGLTVNVQAKKLGPLHNTVALSDTGKMKKDKMSKDIWNTYYLFLLMYISKREGRRTFQLELALDRVMQAFHALLEQILNSHFSFPHRDFPQTIPH